MHICTHILTYVVEGSDDNRCLRILGMFSTIDIHCLGTGISPAKFTIK